MATPTFKFDIIGKFPTAIESTSIFLGFTVTSIRLKTTFAGSPIILVTADGGSNWQEVTGLTSTESKNVTFATSGTDVKWKAIGVPTVDSITYFEMEDLT